jgi:zinc protease
VERKLGREQVHIIVGGHGIRVSSPERMTLRILHTLLGGQGGRLFVELREKKSLAYTVAPMSFEGIEPGYIGTYIACAPDKREQAIAGIRAVYEKLAKTPPSESEMKRAKEFFLGRRAMDLQGDSALAGFYGVQTLYDLPILTEKEVRKRVMDVKAKDIQAFIEKYYLNQPMVTAAVG